MVAVRRGAAGAGLADPAHGKAAALGSDGDPQAAGAPRPGVARLDRRIALARVLQSLAEGAAVAMPIR